MAKFLHYEPCPRCREKGNDNRGDNCAVYSDGGSHCFSCGFHKFPKHYVKPTEEKVNGSKILPIDFSREVPVRAWKWLLQWGLPMSYWQGKVGWSEKDIRLVFTENTFSIGRWQPEFQLALPPEEKPPRKWFVWGNPHQAPVIFGDYGKSKEIILVEDIISANKLGRLTCSIPLFGTKVFNGVLPILRHIGLPVVLWQDKDQQACQPQRCHNLSLLTGLPVRYVVTDNDPKALSGEQIHEALGSST